LLGFGPDIRCLAALHGLGPAPHRLGHCTEAEREIDSRFRFNRYEVYVQDSWRIRSNLTLDYGVRYSVYPPVKDENDVLTNFDPSRYDPARAPQLTAAGTVVAGTGDPLNGIVVAAQNSPHGRGIYGTDTNNVQPRAGHAGARGARRLAGGGDHVPLVGAADLARRQRQHERRAARDPGESGGRSVRQPAGERAGRRVLVRPGRVCAPPDGEYGNTGRAIFRRPGVKQWDITLSKNWFPVEGLRVQFWADLINAFNTVQFDPASISNVCPGNPSCVAAGNRFGQLTSTRAPREIQLGLRLAWR
jgi:hypothetical protein